MGRLMYNDIDYTGSDVVEITQADYNALPDTKYSDDVTYLITDVYSPSSTKEIGLGDCYSTIERVVGCWINGKPLYQKVIVNSNMTIYSTTDLATLTGVDFVIIKDWEYKEGSTGYLNLSTLRIAYSNGNATIKIALDSGTHWEGATFYTVVQYTKTSDIAGSGNWTPEGVPAIHYSTEEQIIGTWIDGKTLYQKTIMPTTTQISNHEYSDSDLSSADMQMIFDGYYVLTNNYLKMPLNQYESSSYYTRTGFRTDKTLYLYAVGYSVTDSAVITVRYTKSS